MMPVYRIWIALALGLLGCAGCATGGGAGGAAAPRKNATAADFYPLANGWKWAYDVDKDGVNILATYAVMERSGDTAIVQAGDQRLTYALTPDGIAQKEGDAIGDYVIKNPVALGAEWPVASGRAKITSVDQEVTLEPAGHFSGCIVVEVTRTEPVRIARTTYAPDVGPLSVEIQVQDGQRFVTTARARLRSVTKPGDELP